MPAELRLIRQRQPVEDQIARGKPKDSLATTLVEDERWKRLSTDLRTRVFKTAKEVYSLTAEGVLRRSQELEQEIPRSPYLSTLVESNGTLTEQHEMLVGIFVDESTTVLPKGSEQRIIARLTQLHLTEWLIGRSIEERYVWIPNRGFEGIEREAQDAISLCVEAVRDTLPPNI